jgi:hypothetical protein
MAIHTPIESPLRVLVEICCFQFFLSDFWPKKDEKQRKKMLFFYDFLKLSCFWP